MSFSEQNRAQYRQFEPHPEVIAALEDDLNTPAAMAILHQLAKGGDVETKQQFFASLSFIGFTNFDLMKSEQDREEEVDAGSDSHIEDLIEARNAARSRKDFKEADRVRDELAKMGVVLKDTKDGTTWEIAR
jgi:cysteinyl-tRNA synthetase